MKSLHTIQRARLSINTKIDRGISRLTSILFFHNYTTLPINQANLNHGFDRFTISRLFFEPVNFLLSGPPTSAPRRSTFQETIHPPRPLLDVPRDAPPAHPARTVTEVDLSSPPLQRGAPPPLRGHSSPNRCCIPKKPRSHCATNRKSSVGLRAGRLEKFHRQAL